MGRTKRAMNWSAKHPLHAKVKIVKVGKDRWTWKLRKGSLPPFQARLQFDSPEAAMLHFASINNR